MIRTANAPSHTSHDPHRAARLSAYIPQRMTDCCLFGCCDNHEAATPRRAQIGQVAA